MMEHVKVFNAKGEKTLKPRKSIESDSLRRRENAKINFSSFQALKTFTRRKVAKISLWMNK